MAQLSRPYMISRKTIALTVQTFVVGKVMSLLFNPVVDVTGDRSKVRCCKGQYCMGTWNVRSMNQGKLEVVKQEVARVNVDILGLEWVNLTQMTIISTTAGRNPSEEME